MAKRVELQEILEEILGSNHVYFQPPESVKMVYPAIRYSLNKIRTQHADNVPYFNKKQYSVILISKDPDNTIVDDIKMLPTCAFERFYTMNNLNHYVFNLYF